MSVQDFQPRHPLRSIRRSGHPSIAHPILIGLVALLEIGIASPGFAQTERLLPGSASPISQMPVNAQVIYVNPVLGQDSPDRGRLDTLPLRTITYALQLAQSNTLIQLAPGSYTRDTGEVFPLAIPEGVILRGDRQNRGQTTVIIGSGEFISPTFARQNITIRALDDSEVSGVTITNPNTRGTGIWVESTNPLISDNTFSYNLREGVFVTGSGNPRIANNTFYNNDGNGVSVARTAQGEIRDNVFQDTGYGIAIGDTSAPRIEGNRIVGNVDGVVISNSARPVLRGNLIENNTRDGVVAISNAFPDLGTGSDPGENIIRNNGRHDLYNATSSNTIVAVGNDIDPERISGSVDFVARDITSPFSFPDIEGHWAQAYIEALAARDIIGGFPDGSYRPDDPVTRAQFAAILSKAFTPTPKRGTVNFVDVQANFWGRQAIDSAYRGGFMAGYPGGLFEPNRRIPRLQVLVSLSSGLELGEGNLSSLSRYADAPQIPSWAAGAIAAATENNIVVNYPNVNQLSPNREATRAEVAAFVYQALVNNGQAEAITSPYLVNPQGNAVP